MRLSQRRVCFQNRKVLVDTEEKFTRQSHSAKAVLSSLTDVNIKSWCLNSPTQTRGFLRAIAQNRSSSHLSLETIKEGAPLSWEDALRQVSRLRYITPGYGTELSRGLPSDAMSVKWADFPPTANTPPTSGHSSSRNPWE